MNLNCTLWITIGNRNRLTSPMPLPSTGKMRIHHSYWKESILAHNIITIQHGPGVKNSVADGLSRMWDRYKRTSTDRSDRSVLLNRKATKGIVNDVLSISYILPDTFFGPIVKHLLGHNAGPTPATWSKATH